MRIMVRGERGDCEGGNRAEEWQMRQKRLETEKGN